MIDASRHDLIRLREERTPLIITGNESGHDIPRGMQVYIVEIRRRGNGTVRIGATPEECDRWNIPIDFVNSQNILAFEDLTIESEYHDNTQNNQKFSKEELQKQRKEVKAQYEEKLNEIDSKIDFLERNEIDSISEKEYQLYETIEIFENKQGLTKKDKVKLTKKVIGIE